jgi:undecaprenyl-diphosphatase
VTGRWPRATSTAGLALVLALGTVTVLAVLVATGWSPLVDLDRSAVRHARALVDDHEALRLAARAVTHLGDPQVVTVLAVLLAALAWVRERRRAAVALLVVRALSVVTSSGLKLLVDRPRPDDVPALTHVTTASFPSGHALGSAALWVSVALLSRHRLGRPTAVAVALVVPLLVAATRVLLGVHFPSDVVAGLLLGVVCAAVGVRAVPGASPGRSPTGRGLFTGSSPAAPTIGPARSSSDHPTPQR